MAQGVLGSPSDHALDVGLRCRTLAELVDGGALLGHGQRVDERVLRGDDGVGHAEAGVGAGGEDPELQLGSAVHGEVELGPLGAPDPVLLHDLGPMGPLEIVEGLEELVGIPGDAEEPLLQIALLDDIARALAGAVREHLLVGQDGLAAGAPVHRGLGPVGEARLEEPQEDRLVPLHVLGVVAVDLAAPVVDGTETPEGGGQLGDPGFGEDPGVGARLDGRVLGRQAERVESDGAEHALALHRLVPDRQVTERVVADMSLVGRTGWIGVHAQRVELRAGVVVLYLVGALVVPVALPFALHRADVVRACHDTRVGDAPARPSLLPDQSGVSGEGGRVGAGRAGAVASAGGGRGVRPSADSVARAAGGVAQLVERLTGSQEVRGFKSHRLHSKSQLNGYI